MASGGESGEGGGSDRRALRERDQDGATEFWTDIGLDPESLGPRGQMAAGLAVGGATLAGIALVFVLVPWLWWLIFVFGWTVFPAAGLFARGVAGMADSRTPSQPDNGDNGRERELLEALRARGELSPAQAAMETSLTVSEADGMLRDLSGGGHLRVSVRGGGLFYSLWETGGPGQPGDGDPPGA